MACQHFLLGLRGVRTHLPGLLVLAIVLVLLRGPNGKLEAFWLQLTTFVGSFLGTGDGLGAVVLQTLSLAETAAIATFLIARRVLTFESMSSVMGLAAIIVGGATV